jgi:SAM-dependent methyltransferase
LQFNWIVTAAPLTYPIYDGLGAWLPQAVGWGGALGLFLWNGRRRLFDALLRRRARAKWRRLAPWIPAEPRRLLDLGAGEGFVADAAAEATGAHATLADVADYRRSQRPLVRFDGSCLPFPDGFFDATLIVYVLHHADDAEDLLAEAVRVTRGPVIVLESVVRVPWTRGAFERLDAVVNRWRSGAPAPRPRWRSVGGWQDVADRLGLTLDRHDVRGVAHPTAVFIVRRPEPRTSPRVADAPPPS